jgi:methionyl aminopeptidase
MIYLKNPEQIGFMREAGAVLYEVLQKLRDAVKPGVTTAALDVYAEQLIRKHKAVPSFLHYHGYPATLCTSVDEQVVHGIPSEDVVLQEGSIISIDCGLVLEGWQADSAFTMGVGEISAQAASLIEITEECFWKGIEKAVAGNRLGDIGHAVQTWAEAHGYSVIRDLTGHGIGRAMHEEPSVFNFGEAGHGIRLRKGMTLAIEPMIAAGGWPVEESENGWTFSTRDKSLAAHYEHTIALGDGLPEILTLPGFTWKEEDA